jgi:hypothetical protein
MMKMRDRADAVRRRMNTAVVSAFLIAAAGVTVAAGPAAADSARLTLTRVSGLQYAGVPATVKVNGKQVASLWGGSSSTVDLAPGKNTVTVDAWSYPGSWTLSLNAKPGSRHTVEISPRDGSYAASLLGPVGAALEGSDKSKQGGAFQARIVTAR